MVHTYPNTDPQLVHSINTTVIATKQEAMKIINGINQLQKDTKVAKQEAEKIINGINQLQEGMKVAKKERKLYFGVVVIFIMIHINLILYLATNIYLAINIS